MFSTAFYKACILVVIIHSYFGNTVWPKLYKKLIMIHWKDNLQIPFQLQLLLKTVYKQVKNTLTLNSRLVIVCIKNLISLSFLFIVLFLYCKVLFHFIMWKMILKKHKSLSIHYVCVCAHVLNCLFSAYCICQVFHFVYFIYCDYSGSLIYEMSSHRVWLEGEGSGYILIHCTWNNIAVHLLMNKY